MSVSVQVSNFQCMSVVCGFLNEDVGVGAWFAFVTELSVAV